jgi:cytochrome c oxidase cbb3-type subunit 3
VDLRPVVPMLVVMGAAVLSASCTRNQDMASAAQGHADAPPAALYPDHVSAGGVSPPGETPTNPYAGDAEKAKSGEQLFSSMNCDGCHGGAGSGWVGPSLADGRWRYGGQDGEVFNSIFYGRPKGMPAYGGVVGRDGVWMLVSYLKSLPVADAVSTQSWIEPRQDAQKEQGAAPIQAPGAQTDTKSAGVAADLETLIQQYGCAGCHAVDRKMVGPSFEAVAARYRTQDGAEQKLVNSAKNGSVGVWGPIRMPPNTGVSDEDLHRIVEQVLSLHSSN